MTASRLSERPTCPRANSLWVLQEVPSQIPAINIEAEAALPKNGADATVVLVGGIELITISG